MNVFTIYVHYEREFSQYFDLIYFASYITKTCRKARDLMLVLNYRTVTLALQFRFINSVIKKNAHERGEELQGFSRLGTGI